MKRIDVSGVRFGKLVAVEQTGRKGKHLLWNCLCDCGKMTSTTLCHLRSGHTRSCGCLIAETAIARNRTHAMSKAPIYAVWASMIRRCKTKTDTSYKYYGNLGVSVCSRWKKFENFFMDMGDRPDGKSIDRINSDGDYEPANCRWATPKQQANNRRKYGSVLAASLAVALLMVSGQTLSAEQIVYQDFRHPSNTFIPSGWMGDTGDLKFEDAYSKDCHSGKTCIKVTYSAKRTGGAGWAGILWQDPANNWGSKKGGFNLNGNDKLTFWARGGMENAYEPRIEEFKMGGITGEYSDSASSSMGPIELGLAWKKYTIDLRNMDLSLVMGGFGFALSADYNEDGATFYLDSIQYE